MTADPNDVMKKTENEKLIIQTMQICQFELLVKKSKNKKLSLHVYC